MRLSGSQSLRRTGAPWSHALKSLPRWGRSPSAWLTATGRAPTEMSTSIRVLHSPWLYVHLKAESVPIDVGGRRRGDERLADERAPPVTEREPAVVHALIQ